MARAKFILFNILSYITLGIWAFTLLLVSIFSNRAAYAVAIHWCVGLDWMSRNLCGLSYEVIGKENIPDEPCVFFIKHSSAYETYIQNLILPRSCWVLKRELLFIPFFGWALFPLRAIAIDRSSGQAAVKQVIEQGKQRLADGIYISIFPEGTRMPAGQTKRYGISGTLLAQATGVPIVPIAHNAGYYWPRRAKAINPGKVTFVIGQPVDPAGREPRELNSEIQAWVEAEVEKIVAADSAGRK